tara:strand:- start:156 stop:293 length:138 start_codon:yes stop_codon:yes gene_type:complete
MKLKENDVRETFTSEEKFSIESLYESSQLSEDCGISEITIFGRDS